MCRLLFAAPKASDALLFMTILSTDLRALRRRGYNGMSFIIENMVSPVLNCTILPVDRILQRQKVEAAENTAREKAKQTALVSQSSPGASSTPVPPIPKDTRPVSPPPSITSSATETTLGEGSNDRDKHRPQSMLRNLRKKIIGDNSPPQIPGALPIEHHVAPPSGNTPLLMPPRPNPSRPATPGPSVTPMSNIGDDLQLSAYGSLLICLPRDQHQHGYSSLQRGKGQFAEKQGRDEDRQGIAQ